MTLVGAAGAGAAENSPGRDSPVPKRHTGAVPAHTRVLCTLPGPQAAGVPQAKRGCCPILAPWKPQHFCHAVSRGCWPAAFLQRLDLFPSLPSLQPRCISGLLGIEARRLIPAPDPEPSAPLNRDQGLLLPPQVLQLRQPRCEGSVGQHLASVFQSSTSCRCA